MPAPRFPCCLRHRCRQLSATPCRGATQVMIALDTYASTTSQAFFAAPQPPLSTTGEDLYSRRQASFQSLVEQYLLFDSHR